MKTRLLRKLRKEARERIHLIPYRLKDNTTVIHEKGVCAELDKYYSYNRHYHSNTNIHDYDQYIDWTLDLDNIIYPFTEEEGIKELETVRREYVINLVKRMKRERKERKEMEEYRNKIKELAKY